MANGYTLLNNVAVKNLASTILFENIVQKILVLPNKGCDFKYCQDLNANSVAVQRTKLTEDGRQLGESVNGDYFDNSYGTLQSQIFDINLDIVASRAVKVPAIAEIMNGNGMLLKSVLMNVPKTIAKVVNCSYLATLIASATQKAIKATSATGTVTYAWDTGMYNVINGTTPQDAMSAFDSAVGNLGNGDPDNGFDVFPLENTQLFAKPKYLQTLKNNAGLFVNNTLAQQMLASGSFSAYDASYTPDIIEGYWGEINGVMIYNVGSLYNSAERWLGTQNLSTNAKTVITAGALTNLQAILVCGLAVAGGIDLRSEVKVIDAYGGQGWEVQPNARCGFSVFSPYGVQLIVSQAGLTATNFVTYTGSGSAATQTVKPTIYAPLNR